MNALVDFARLVDIKDIVSIHIVFCNEIHASEGSDQGARDAKHHGHTKQEHHSGILLTESELVTNVPTNCRSFGFGPRPTNLNKIQEHVGKSNEF